MTHHVVPWRDLSDLNIELFVRYEPGIIHNNTYYTDSNGLNLIKRHYGVSEQFRERVYKLEHNVYPVNRLVWTEDVEEKNLEFGLVIDRPTGCVYLPSQQLLVQLQRNVFSGDNKGMDESYIPDKIIHLDHVLFLGQDVKPKMRREQIIMEKEDVFLIQEIGQDQFNNINSQFLNFSLSSKTSSESISESVETIFVDLISKNIQVNIASRNFEKEEIFLTIINLNDANSVNISNIGSKIKQIYNVDMKQSTDDRVLSIEVVSLNQEDMASGNHFWDDSVGYEIEPVGILVLKVIYKRK